MNPLEMKHKNTEAEKKANLQGNDRLNMNYVYLEHRNIRNRNRRN